MAVPKTIALAYRALQKRDISSVELTRAVLDQIRQFDPQIKAFLYFDQDQAITQARASDSRRRSGQSKGILDGIPIALKDVLVTTDMPTTAASKILEGFMSAYDATVVAKLRSQGAVLIGKTNMDEFAMGSSTENSAYGPTKNPWDLGRVPGGSSGGSAAALAAGMCLAALGSDTGGSIRQPASFCGVVGFKPSYGAVSRYGLIAMSSSLDQIGPMTQTVADAKILFEAIKGQDRSDATSVQIKRPTRSNRQVKAIGLAKEYFGQGLDSQVKPLVVRAIELLARSTGADIVEISLPNARFSVSVYYILMSSEVASNLARYDGVKYGLQIQGDTLLESYLESRSKGFGQEAKRRIMLGTFSSSAGYSDQYYQKAQLARAKIKQDFDQAFEKVDLIAAPVAPTTAFKLGEKVDQPLQMYLSDIYTIPTNLAGLPGISIPCGLVEGLPVGLQLMANRFEDEFLLDIGQKYDQARGQLPGPPYTSGTNAKGRQIKVRLKL